MIEALLTQPPEMVARILGIGEDTSYCIDAELLENLERWYNSYYRHGKEIPSRTGIESLRIHKER
jgi:hypothetical protein